MEKIRKFVSVALLIAAVVCAAAGTNDYSSTSFILLMILCVVTAVALAVVLFPGSLYQHLVERGVLEGESPRLAHSERSEEFNRADNAAYEAYKAGHRPLRRPRRCMAIREDEPTVPLFEEE